MAHKSPAGAQSTSMPMLRPLAINLDNLPEDEHDWKESTKIKPGAEALLLVSPRGLTKSEGQIPQSDEKSRDRFPYLPKRAVSRPELTRQNGIRKSLSGASQLKSIAATQLQDSMLLVGLHRPENNSSPLSRNAPPPRVAKWHRSWDGARSPNDLQPGSNADLTCITEEGRHLSVKQSEGESSGEGGGSDIFDLTVRRPLDSDDDDCDVLHLSKKSPRMTNSAPGSPACRSPPPNLRISLVTDDHDDDDDEDSDNPKLKRTNSKESIPPMDRSWIVLVNRNSGGKMGARMLQLFSTALPGQVYDLLNDKGPQNALEAWAEDPLRFKILVCGGDGTANWVLGGIDKFLAMPEHKDLQWPVIGILPLGTGNDLSRTLGWGHQYEKKPVYKVLSDFRSAPVISLDRWTLQCISYTVKEEGESEKQKEPEQAVNKGNGKEKEGSQIEISGVVSQEKAQIMNNYFSIGLDASIVLGFHQLREKNTSLFQGVLLNKGWYATFSAREAMLGTKKMYKIIALFIDHKPVPLDKKLKGLVVLNLPTYGGGNLWGTTAPSQTSGFSSFPSLLSPRGGSREPVDKEASEDFRTPSIDDGLLEVVGLKSVAHLGMITTGVGAGVKIGQGRHIELVTNTELAAQVDGEPWVMGGNSRVVISHLNQAPFLTKPPRSAGRTSRSNTNTAPLSVYV